MLRCLWFCHWAQLNSISVLFARSLQVFAHMDKIHLSLLNTLSTFPHRRDALILAIHWTLSSLSMSLLHGGSQKLDPAFLSRHQCTPDSPVCLLPLPSFHNFVVCAVFKLFLCSFFANHTGSEIGEESGSLPEPVMWSLAIDVKVGSRRKANKTYLETEERLIKGQASYFSTWDIEKIDMPMPVAKCIKKFVIFSFLFFCIDQLLFIPDFPCRIIVLILMSSSKSFILLPQSSTFEAF